MIQIDAADHSVKFNCHCIHSDVFQGMFLPKKQRFANVASVGFHDASVMY